MSFVGVDVAQTRGYLALGFELCHGGPGDRELVPILPHVLKRMAFGDVGGMETAARSRWPANPETSCFGNLCVNR